MTVKEKFHQLIDAIDNDEMLAAYFNLISQLKKQETGRQLLELSEEQKEELNLAYNESFLPAHLLSHEEVKSQHSRWLGEK